MNPVSRLMIFCSSHGLLQPVFEEIKQELSGNSIIFTIKLSVGEVEIILSGSNRTEVRYQLSNDLLKILERKLKEKSSGVNCQREECLSANLSIESLTNICRQRSLPPPKFVIVGDKGPPHSKIFTVECHVGELVASASAISKSSGKRKAAQSLLNKLDSRFDNETEASTESTLPLENSCETSENFLQYLFMICSELRLPEPVLNIINTVGRPHEMLFTCECKVSSYYVRAVAKRKALSKHVAAKKMIKELISKGLLENTQTLKNIKVSDISSIPNDENFGGVAKCLIKPVSEKLMAQHIALEKELEDFKIECFLPSYSIKNLRLPLDCSIYIYNFHALKKFLDIYIKQKKRFPTIEDINDIRNLFNNPKSLEIIKSFDEMMNEVEGDPVRKLKNLVENSDVCVEFMKMPVFKNDSVFTCSLIPKPNLVTNGTGPFAIEKSAHKMLEILKLYVT